MRKLSAGLKARKIVHRAARNGDFSALQYAIKRGDDVNSVDKVSWFVGM